MRLVLDALKLKLRGFIMLDEKTVTTIRLIIRDEMAPLNTSLADLTAVVRMRHELSREQDIVKRVGKLEKEHAHLTGKITGVAALFSLLFSTLTRYIIK